MAFLELHKVCLIYLFMQAAACVQYTGWPKISKPLPNDQKNVLNRIKACQWD